MSNLLKRAAAELNGTGPQESLVDLAKSSVVWLSLAKILDNPYQPRIRYDATHIANLATSIASLKDELPNTLGLQQVPLARVGKFDADGEFDAAPRALYNDPTQLRRYLGERGACVQLMFGHSRLRAFMVLAEGPKGYFSEWDKEIVWPEQDPAYLQMPVMLGFALDIAMWQHAITENAQRKNITAIEEAKTLQRAVDEFGLTLEEAGKPFGYTNKSTVSNKIRLLDLPADIQTAVEQGEITERHARELLLLKASPERLRKAYQNAKTYNQTASQLAEDVKREKKRMEEEMEVQRQLDAARATLVKGWTPPGASAPLPAERVHTGNAWIQMFDLDDSTSKALLYTGRCGNHCDCFVVGHMSYCKPGYVRPNAEAAPNVCLGCTGGWEARRNKLEELRQSSAPIIATDAELEQKRLQQERAAKAEALNTAARTEWETGLAQLDRAAFMGDIRFWRIVASHSYNAIHQAAQAKTLEAFRDGLLEQLFTRCRDFSRELDDWVADIEEVRTLLDLLAGRVELETAEDSDDDAEDEEAEKTIPTL